MADFRYLLEVDTGDEIYRFSSAVRDNELQSDITYASSDGTRYSYPVRFEKIPSINQKISDSISEAIILNQWNISVVNYDGLFDRIDEKKIFNAKTTLKRSNKMTPTLDDFSVIAYGLVDYPVISPTKLKLVVNTTYRALTEEVTKTFSTDDYPNIPESNEDQNIPIAYGPSLSNVPLFQIDSTDETQYLAIDPDYLLGVTAVYDSDGNSIAFTGPDSSGIITATDASTADITGASGNRIGQIIQNETVVKSGIVYNSENWELSESDIYIASSAKLNFYFSGGTVRELVDAVLKSDNAFFFTKNNGLLTIRQWALTYTIHEIDSWKITQFSGKDYKSAKKYLNTSVVMKYDKNQSDSTYSNQIINATEEADIISTYGVTQTRETYKTDLYENDSLLDLSTRLVNRFGFPSPQTKIGSAYSALNVNLLDTVKINVTINERSYTDELYWIVREVNPSQDTMMLEARSGFSEPDTTSGYFSQPISDEERSGVLSEVFTSGEDGRPGNFSQPLTVLV